MASDDIPYRWTAQDKMTPAKCRNPYGIDPTRLVVDKKSASQLDDGDVIAMPRSICGYPGMLKEFSVDGATWEPIPAGVEAATIGEMCAALYKRNADKYFLYVDFVVAADKSKGPTAELLATNRRQSIAKKLFNYWANTDYRWAVLHSGVDLTDLDQHPEKIRTQATGKATRNDGTTMEIKGKLTHVLVRAASTASVAVKPNPVPSKDASADGASDGDKGAPGKTTVVVPSGPKLTADPPVGSPYWKLPQELRDTLVRSFADRVAGLPDTEANLMFGWGTAPQPLPKTAWEALDYLGLTAVNFLVRLFERIKGCDSTLATWKQIKYIRNQWWGGSAGMKVVYFDPPAMRKALDDLIWGMNGTKVARDTFFSGSEHQQPSSISLLPRSIGDWWDHDGTSAPVDTDTWREVAKLGEEGLHFCVSRYDLTRGPVLDEIACDVEYKPRPASSDDIHIDWECPVKSIGQNNRCDIDLGISGAAHWVGAVFGSNHPMFVFEDVPKKIDELRKLGGPDDPEGAAILGDIPERWEKNKKDYAVSGKAGYDDAMKIYKELETAQTFAMIGTGPSTAAETPQE